MSTLLREFLYRSREWSQAVRGAELARMAAKDLSELADIDSGFFVYKRRFPADQKPAIFAPWGIFQNDEHRLNNLADFILSQVNLRPLIMERWMPSSDLPIELQRVFGRHRILEVGIWPIVSHGQIIGAMVVARTQAAVFVQPTVETDIALLDVCAAQISLAMDLFLMTRIAENASERDALTGLLNRRGFETQLPRHVEQVQKAGQYVMFGLIDLNDLKLINDRHGHPAGDRVLRQIGDILRSNVRSNGLVSRFGGDEFAVVIQTDRPDAELAMRRIQEAVEEQSIGHSVSVGGAVWGVDGESLEQCYLVADERLYECKRQTKTKT